MEDNLVEEGNLAVEDNLVVDNLAVEDSHFEGDNSVEAEHQRVQLELGYLSKGHLASPYFFQESIYWLGEIKSMKKK